MEDGKLFSFAFFEGLESEAHSIHHQTTTRAFRVAGDPFPVGCIHPCCNYMWPLGARILWRSFTLPERIVAVKSAQGRPSSSLLDMLWCHRLSSGGTHM